MIYYQCPQCKAVETVSLDAVIIYHRHDALYILNRLSYRQAQQILRRQEKVVKV